MASKKAKAPRIVKNALHIFCEGEKSEPYYLRGYINHFYPTYRNIIIIEDTTKNSPIELVEEAIKAKKSNPTNDQFWVVFDREAINKRSHTMHQKARQKAQSSGINLALSCICFEMWLLLHIKRTTASYANCDELIKSTNFKELLNQANLPNYDKGYSQLFDHLKKHIPTAIQNAKSINASAISTDPDLENQPHHYNPYTDMHKLLEAIEEFCKNSG